MTVVWLYWPLTKYFFFQDDFILLSMAGSVKNWWDVFRFSDVIFWRPLSVQIYFNLARSLFGLEPFWYHFISLVLHLINSLLVWKLVNKLSKNTSISWLSGFLFATSPIHFMSQIWIGEFPIILGQSLWLVGVLLAIKWLQSPIWRNSIWFFLIFSFGLMAHEMVLTLPLMLLVTVYVSRKIDNKREFIYRKILQLLLMGFPAVAYLLLRLFIFPVTATGQYELQINGEAAKSVWWYLLWMLNVPENITYQSLFPLRIRPEFVKHFPLRSLWWTLQPLILTLILGSSLLVKKFHDFTWNKKYIQLGLLWFGIGFSILLLALGHKYPFLLTFALPGFAILLSASIIAFIKNASRAKTYLILGSFIIMWLTSSWLTLRFTESTHWTAKEALIAEKLIFQVKQHPYISTSNIVIIPLGDDNQRQASLADQLGLQIMFNNPLIRTYYSEPDNLNPPECVGLETEELDDCIKSHLIVRIKG